MATWFAQNNSVNIDSVNQWNSAANGSGSWLTWASLDPSDILVANGKTSITINVSFTCATITTAATGGTAGGGFLLAAGVTVTANVVADTTTCVTRTVTGASSSIVGNVTGGTSNTAYGLNHNSISTILVTGNVTSGTGTNAWGIAVVNGGQLTVTGNATGASSGVAGRAIGIQTTNGAIVSIVGNVTGGAGGTQTAGLFLLANATVSITGNVTAGAASPAIEISTTVTSPILIVGDLQSSTAHPAIYSTANNAVICHSGTVTTVAGGREIAGYITYRIHPTNALAWQYRTYNTTTYADLGSRSLYTGGVNLNQPAIADVRSGTVYGATSEYTGTLAVPSPTLVAIGVATDNTVGSYAPTGGLDAAGVRSAIGLASANLDTQLSGLQSDTNDIQTRLPAALVGGKMDSIAALDSAVRVKLDASQPDYDLPTNAELATALAAADDAVLAAIAALNNLSAAQVNAEILDVLSVDTFGELSAPPAATSSLKDKLTWLFMWVKNKATETSTQRKLYADNSTTVVSTETVSDDGTTFTKTKAS